MELISGCPRPSVSIPLGLIQYRPSLLALSGRACNMGKVQLCLCVAWGENSRWESYTESAANDTSGLFSILFSACKRSRAWRCSMKLRVYIMPDSRVEKTQSSDCPGLNYMISPNPIDPSRAAAPFVREQSLASPVQTKIGPLIICSHAGPSLPS